MPSTATDFSASDSVATESLAIRVRGVSKAFRVYPTPGDRFRQAFAWGRRQYYNEFWALRDIDFDVLRGDMVGLIGRNGSGKSTLLQIVAGTLAATSGEVTVHGRVAALLELGAGFDPEASGAENIFMNGLLVGLSRGEIEARFDEIVRFADIGQFIQQPVKTYSSGMVVRLAFAVAAHVEASVLIVDEALAVGDAVFQAKCFRRIADLRARGVTILLATHDMSVIRTMCRHALLLEDGRAAMWGPAKLVADEYYRRVQAVEWRDLPKSALQDGVSEPGAASGLEPLSGGRGTRLGDGSAEVYGLSVYDHEGRRTRAVRARQPFRVELGLRFHRALRNPHAGVALRDVQSRMLLGAHTMYEDVRLGPTRPGQHVVLTFQMQASLNPGVYLLMFGVAEHLAWDSWVDCDIFYDFCEIEIYGDERAWGMLNVPTPIEVREVQSGDS